MFLSMCEYALIKSNPKTRRRHGVLPHPGFYKLNFVPIAAL